MRRQRQGRTDKDLLSSSGGVQARAARNVERARGRLRVVVSRPAGPPPMQRLSLRFNPRRQLGSSREGRQQADGLPPTSRVAAGGSPQLRRKGLLLLIPRPLRQTSTTPSSVTEDDLSPKSILSIRDLDGEGKEWVVRCSCAKVSICTTLCPSTTGSSANSFTDNSKNVTLRLEGRILTSTVELFSSGAIRLFIGSPPSSPDSPSPLGILQLDPTLKDVAITYTHPSSVGSVIIAPSRSSASFGFTNVSVGIAGREPFRFADADGRLCEPQAPFAVVSPGSAEAAGLPEQWVLRLTRNGDWESGALARGDKDYPDF